MNHITILFADGSVLIASAENLSKVSWPGVLTKLQVSEVSLGQCSVLFLAELGCGF